MEEKISKKNLNIIAGIIILAILVFLFGNRNFHSVLILREKLDKLNMEISKLKQDNTRLEEELRMVKESPEYFEDLARKKLGMIKPGETKYKIVPKKGSSNNQ
jgi:cell division protein FtsB